jgi:oligopeptide transport system ATP-binding protein
MLEVRRPQDVLPISKGIIFQRQVGAIKAVDGLNFFVRRGETLGLVGESGCGKSTTGARSCSSTGPRRAGALRGEDLTKMKGEDLRKMRRQMQMIFQDPYASLNPRMTVGSIVGEPLESTTRHRAGKARRSGCRSCSRRGAEPLLR